MDSCLVGAPPSTEGLNDLIDELEGLGDDEEEEEEKEPTAFGSDDDREEGEEEGEAGEPTWTRNTQHRAKSNDDEFSSTPLKAETTVPSSLTPLPITPLSSTTTSTSRRKNRQHARTQSSLDVPLLPTGTLEILRSEDATSPPSSTSNSPNNTLQSLDDLGGIDGDRGSNGGQRRRSKKSKRSMMTTTTPSHDRIVRIVKHCSLQLHPPPPLIQKMLEMEEAEADGREREGEREREREEVTLMSLLRLHFQLLSTNTTYRESLLTGCIQHDCQIARLHLMDVAECLSAHSTNNNNNNDRTAG